MQTIITTVGGNLFELAAQHLGSPLHCIDLARTNKISDPFLSGENTIIIPRWSSGFSDGIGPQ